MVKTCANNLPTCDRRVVFAYFQAIERKARGVLNSIKLEIQRAQTLKAHPHPMFYQRTITVANPNACNGIRLRTVAYERAAETIDMLRQDDVMDNIEFVAQLIDSSFQYQVAAKNVNDLNNFIEASLRDFHETHTDYDRQLAAIERKDMTSSDAVVAINETQERLQEIKDTLQQFINQVPSQLAIVRTENDNVQNLYDGVDDSIVIHRFLTSQYSKALIDQSDSANLKRSAGFIKHQWSALLTPSASV